LKHQRHKSSSLRTLVAARVRRPPHGQPAANAGSADASGLRLRRDDPDNGAREASGRTSIHDAAALQDISQAAKGLRVADAGLGRIESTLRQLHDGVRQCRAICDEGGVVATFDREFHGALDAVRQIVADTRQGGRRLLAGDWYVALANPATGRTEVLHIPSMSPEDLTGVEPAGGCDDLLAAADAGPAVWDRLERWIVTALRQVCRFRDQIITFVKNTIGPLLDALEVARQNLEAARGAVVDVDFATATGRLTRADAFLHGQANAAPNGGLRISHGGQSSEG